MQHISINACSNRMWQLGFTNVLWTHVFTSPASCPDTFTLKLALFCSYRQTFVFRLNLAFQFKICFNYNKTLCQVIVFKGRTCNICCKTLSVEKNFLGFRQVTRGCFFRYNITGKMFETDLMSTMLLLLRTGKIPKNKVFLEFLWIPKFWVCSLFTGNLMQNPFSNWLFIAPVQIKQSKFRIF